MPKGGPDGAVVVDSRESAPDRTTATGVTYDALKARMPYYTEVMRGNVTDADGRLKFGCNTDIDTADGFQVISEGTGVSKTYTGQDATEAEVVEISSASANDAAGGTGARTIQVYGLDSDWLEQSETVTLAGATWVETVNEYVRMDRGVIRSAGSGGGSAAVITARQVTTTANIFIEMLIGYNQTMICAWTSPADETVAILSRFVGLAGKTSATITSRLRVRPFGEVYQVKEQFSIGASGGSPFFRPYGIPNGPYAGKTDFYVEADTDTNGTAVAAALDFDRWKT